MICPYCGKNIPDGVNTCPLCGKSTEFSDRFFHIPEPSPLTRPISSKKPEGNKNNNSSDPNVMPTMNRLLEIGERIFTEHQQIEGALQKGNKDIGRKLNRSYLIHGIISIVAILLILVSSLVSLHATKREVKNIGLQLNSLASELAAHNAANTVPEEPNVPAVPDKSEKPAEGNLSWPTPTFKPGLSGKLPTPPEDTQNPVIGVSAEGVEAE